MTVYVLQTQIQHRANVWIKFKNVYCRNEREIVLRTIGSSAVLSRSILTLDIKLEINMLRKLRLLFIFLGSQLTDFDIHVGNYLDESMSLCAHHSGAAPGAQAIVFYCPCDTLGQYVKISMTSNHSLSLCEVEVYNTTGKVPTLLICDCMII